MRFVQVRRINVEISTGKHMLPRNHHRLNIVANMDRLGRRTRWTMEATKGKGRVEAARLDRNPEKLNTRNRDTAGKNAAGQVIGTRYGNTNTTTVAISTKQSTQVYVSQLSTGCGIVFAKHKSIFWPC